MVIRIIFKQLILARSNSICKHLSCRIQFQKKNEIEAGRRRKLLPLQSHLGLPSLSIFLCLFTPFQFYKFLVTQRLPLRISSLVTLIKQSSFLLHSRPTFVLLYSSFPSFLMMNSASELLKSLNMKP